ncbi:hypothetical protein [Paenibacillus sp. FSL H3-0333]|uniref:hypothetical protein n=1 Tax=Paenibacillus sp. FSL H3-0333 TaxID=2921373 RepID=UPI0030F63F85
MTDQLSWGVKSTTNKNSTKTPIRAEGTLSLWPKNSTDQNSPYNFAVIEGVRGGVPFTEVWLMVNAYYDYATHRFKRVNTMNFSFGWQWMGGGTYPGEENIGDFVNQGINLWKANGKAAYAEGDPARDLTGEDIGAYENGEWREFGIMLGWNNHFMLDAYGGMTIGGAGFEIDGSGTSPFKRVSLGKFSGGSRDGKAVNDYVYAYNGTCWNTQHGLWNKDEDQLDGYYYGLESPINFYDQGETFNPGSNRADMQHTKFVVKKLPGYMRPHVENWQNLLSINQDGLMELNGFDTIATFSRDDNPNGATTLLIPFPDSTWNKDNMIITSFIGTTIYYTEHMKNKGMTWTNEGLLLNLDFGYYTNIHTSFKKIKKNIIKINPSSGITINDTPLNSRKIVNVDLIPGSTDFNMNFPDSSWTKENTMVVAVIGTLADGNRRQLAVNCTITPYGMYGGLGTNEYTSAKVILEKY